MKPDTKIAIATELKNSGFIVDLDDIQVGEKIRVKTVIDQKDKAGEIEIKSGSDDDFYLVNYKNYYDGDGGYFNASRGKVIKKQKVKSEFKLEIENLQAGKKTLDERFDIASKNCTKLWMNYNPVGQSEYLLSKGIKTLFGARIDGRATVIPIHDIDGRIWSLQHIYVSGVTFDGKTKVFYDGGKVAGNFYKIEGAESDIYICEGFATGVSIKLAKPESMVICALNCGNLEPVAINVRAKYPKAKITICADNDLDTPKGNVGVLHARKACELINGYLATPESRDGHSIDFDDVRAQFGDAEVSRQLEKSFFIQKEELKLKLVEQSADVIELETECFPDVDDKNRPLGTIRNYEELLRRMGIHYRYNIIRRCAEIRSDKIRLPVGDEQNQLYGYVLDAAIKYKLPIMNRAETVDTLIRDSEYNPVTNWIDSKPWDGVSRVQSFYDTLVSENVTLKEKLMRVWMLSAIAAAYSKAGFSCSGMLVLQGRQYMGKTNWLKNLCPKELNLVADGKFLRMDDKDTVIDCTSYWITELGELETTLTKSNLGQFKAFLTRDTDVIRAPYGRKSSMFPRHTVFYGSVNEADFLKDKTGNRRFWVIPCTEINHTHGLDMQQIWAEFKEMYFKDQGAVILDSATLQELNYSNEAFEEFDPVKDAVTSYFKTVTKEEWLTPLDVSKRINFYTNDYRAIGRVLRELFGDPKRTNRGHAFKTNQF